VINFGSESVRRKPFDHGIGVEEGAIDAFGFGAKDAMKFNGGSVVGAHVVGIIMKGTDTSLL